VTHITVNVNMIAHTDDDARKNSCW